MNQAEADKGGMDAGGIKEARVLLTRLPWPDVRKGTAASPNRQEPCGVARWLMWSLRGRRLFSIKGSWMVSDE